MILAAWTSLMCLTKRTEEEDPLRLVGSPHRRGPREIQSTCLQSYKNPKATRIWLRSISTIVQGGKTSPGLQTRRKQGSSVHYKHTRSSSGVL